MATVSKAQVVEALRARGDHAVADRLNQELPDQVDPNDYPAVMTALDLDVGDAARHGEPAPGGAEEPTGLPSTEPSRAD